MYSTCLFCNKSLGSNETIEAFPVGRRMAFDGAKGRLWVVCRHCERWNLAPFDQRWEALEDCERRFRDARKRVSTDNIGLARLDEGLELVRIGDPLRPEFAAWRYGDQFGRRRRRAIAAGAGIGTVVSLAVAVGAGTGILAGGSWWIAQAVARGVEGIQNQRTVARIPLEGGTVLTVKGGDLQWVRLLPGSDPNDLRLILWHPTGETEITGAHALHATTLLMPKVNRRGAGKKQVQNAVKLSENCGESGPRQRQIRPMTIRRNRGGESLPALALSTLQTGRLPVRPSVRLPPRPRPIGNHLSVNHGVIPKSA